MADGRGSGERGAAQVGRSEVGAGKRGEEAKREQGFGMEHGWGHSPGSSRPNFLVASGSSAPNVVG